VQSTRYKHAATVDGVVFLQKLVVASRSRGRAFSRQKSLYRPAVRFAKVPAPRHAREQVLRRAACRVHGRVSVPVSPCFSPKQIAYGRRPTLHGKRDASPAHVSPHAYAYAYEYTRAARARVAHTSIRKNIRVRACVRACI